MHQRHAGVPFILICVLLDILGIGLIIPVLPQLVGDLAGNKAAQAWWLGAMMISYGVMQFFFAPTLGALADRFGRRPVLLVGMGGLATMFLVPALFPSLPLILASRIFGGMFSANFAVAQAYIADVTPKEKRAASFGMLGACFGIGFILGPAIGGVLGEQDVRIPFLLAAVLSALNFVYGVFILPESLPREHRKNITFARCNPFRVLLGLGRLKVIGSLIAVVALATFAQSMMHSTWTIYTNIRYGWTPLDIGLSMVTIGAVSVVMQGFAMRVFLRWWGERNLILAGLFSGALAYIAFGAASAGWVTYIIIVLNFLSVAVGPTLSALISKEIGAEDQGVSMGAISSLNSLMGVLAPTVGTPLLVHTVHQQTGSALAGLLYFLCAGVLFFAAALALCHFRKAGAES
jgi:DHA1 family tetracycline resistance protein-like MFS transporter